MSADITVLEMRGDSSVVQRVADGQTLFISEFPLGVDSLVRQSVRHEPPWPIELEHAIELTEEAVMPLAAQCAGTAGLILRGLGAALIARSLKTSGITQAILTLDDVEVLFNRLVSISEGRPASQEMLATDARFFSAMLMLREFMHHMYFVQVTLEPAKE